MYKMGYSMFGRFRNCNTVFHGIGKKCKNRWAGKLGIYILFVFYI